MNSRRRNNQHCAQFMNVSHETPHAGNKHQSPITDDMCVSVSVYGAQSALLPGEPNKTSLKSKPPYVITNYYCKRCKKIRLMGWGQRAKIERYTGGLRAKLERYTGE